MFITIDNVIFNTDSIASIATDSLGNILIRTNDGCVSEFQAHEHHTKAAKQYFGNLSTPIMKLAGYTSDAEETDAAFFERYERQAIKN